MEKKSLNPDAVPVQVRHVSHHCDLPEITQEQQELVHLDHSYNDNVKSDKIDKAFSPCDFTPLLFLGQLFLLDYCLNASPCKAPPQPKTHKKADPLTSENHIYILFRISNYNDCIITQKIFQISQFQSLAS